ncbi:MAG: sigma-70 family RNA polymerase sigma factor [Xanthomonadales bacterium]|nr:sigma-70 family RNA polymerase sigma factor [Xanthomonadales bacterium]
MGGVARVKAWSAANTGHDEDQNLVTLALGGDVPAFESLYRRHRDRVHGLVWRLCGCNQALAEDVLQETFVRAWTKLHLFRGESLFGTWLHRLAVNVALSDRRIRVRRARFESSRDETAERTASGHRDVHAADHRDLERAIAGLPERARLTVASMSGDVRLQLPSGQQAEYTAQTFSGDIESGFGEVSGNSRGPGHSLSLHAGDNGATIQIESFSGDINITGPNITAP